MSMGIGQNKVLITGLMACLFLGGAAVYKASALPDPIALDTKGRPSIGHGPVELVVFEDLCCTNCRTFTEEIFPLIASQYVDTGKARLTVIPVSFGSNSKPIANAALSVYKMAPDRFIPFVLLLLQSEAEKREEILLVAQVVGGIDMQALTYSIDHELYYSEIDQNLAWAKSLMGDDFGTPTLFVNGIQTSTASFAAVEHRIKQLGKGK